jgi:hypothetical protein
MKKIVISTLAALLLFLVSCERLDQIPDIPEMPDSIEETERHGTDLSHALYFYSEEELQEHFRSGEVLRIENESKTISYDVPKHYYKLKNPPPEVVIVHIGIAHHVIVRYGTQKGDDWGEPLHIQYIHTLSYDIETEGIWRSLAFPEESYIREIDGINYYIRKGMGRDTPVWAVEWVNADGYNMKAQFPYRFTADEVLGYVSDLERVEIG